MSWAIKDEWKHSLSFCALKNIFELEQQNDLVVSEIPKPSRPCGLCRRDKRSRNRKRGAKNAALKTY
jgi:hypothetical protein